MMDRKLLDYIKQNKKQGFSDEQIKKALLDAGRKEEDIEKNVGSLASNIKPFFLETLHSEMDTFNQVLSTFKFIP